MAFNTKVGSIVQPTSTGNQSTTGVGFQPSAIIFYVNSRTSDGSTTTESVIGFGFATSSSNRASICNNTSGSSANGRRHDNTKCILFCTNAGNLLTAADFVSFDADGFTVNWTTADATQRVVNYVALGGADLTNVTIKEFTSPTSTGSQGYTGIGFQPSAMLVFGIQRSSAPASGGGYQAFTFGMASGASNQGLMSGVNANSFRMQLTDGVIGFPDTGPAIVRKAALTSFDADGFTLNWSNVGGSAEYYWALCLKGGQYKVGSFNQATGTGTQATTGIGFQPTGLSLMSFNNAASATALTVQRASFGAGSSSSARGAIWEGNTDSADFNQNLDRTKIIKMITEGTPTVNAAADLTSLDSDGWTFDWTTADATARQIVYMAFGSTAVAASNPHRLMMMGVGI